eukprot:CAMPEP_0197521696 /NCGR_PEP_ID=MMETSP1318-20131121/6947_1 /TAXON_ID=552666 /ORGANISM="Partenskyella glossopodia, Strain RCC365" /LENGTH=187 /DNA_ID=CAMNT_0043073793 /DNA_START=150 /DNA_END=713 /DNA_ORIENTATION=-
MKQESAGETKQGMSEIYQMVVGRVGNTGIRCADIADVMNVLGMNVQEHEILHIFAKYKKEKESIVSAEEFADVMSDIPELGHTRREIDDAFQALKGSQREQPGEIGTSVLQRWLLLYKNSIPKEVIRDLVAELPTNENGEFGYTGYLDSVFPETAIQNKVVTKVKKQSRYSRQTTSSQNKRRERRIL